MRFANWMARVAIIIIVGAVVFYFWQQQHNHKIPEYLASGNGRIEAVEFSIAPRQTGRIERLVVREGEFVKAGQLLVSMDTESLQARLRQAQAKVRQAQDAVAISVSQLSLRESEKRMVVALVSQRRTELKAAKQRMQRYRDLQQRSYVSRQQLDDQIEAVDRAQASLTATVAQLASSDAAIEMAQKQIQSAESMLAAALAEVELIQSDINDGTLNAPRDGRIQLVVAHEGEVVGAGASVLNLLDLNDMYMTFFLPTAAVGRIALGSEVRLVLDAMPEYVIPAQIAFVSDVAQFTPKTVETLVEREKLMFRVRAQLPTDLLAKHPNMAKTGLPGMAYVKLDAQAAWPDYLALRLPE